MNHSNLEYISNTLLREMSFPTSHSKWTCVRNPRPNSRNFPIGWSWHECVKLTISRPLVKRETLHSSIGRDDNWTCVSIRLRGGWTILNRTWHFYCCCWVCYVFMGVCMHVWNCEVLNHDAVAFAGSWQRVGFHWVTRLSWISRPKYAGRTQRAFFVGMKFSHHLAHHMPNVSITNRCPGFRRHRPMRILIERNTIGLHWKTIIVIELLLVAETSRFKDY